MLLSRAGVLASFALLRRYYADIPSAAAPA
jgi:hypothetical protein